MPETLGKVACICINFGIAIIEVSLGLDDKLLVPSSSFLSLRLYIQRYFDGIIVKFSISVSLTFVTYLISL